MSNATPPSLAHLAADTFQQKKCPESFSLGSDISTLPRLPSSLSIANNGILYPHQQQQSETKRAMSSSDLLAATSSSSCSSLSESKLREVAHSLSNSSPARSSTVQSTDEVFRKSSSMRWDFASLLSEQFQIKSI